MTQGRSGTPYLSVMALSRQRLHAGAWLALLSMALIFAAPLYSRSMALMQPAGHHGMASEPNDSPADHEGMSHHGASEPSGQADADSHPTFLHAECGYCVLIAHIAPLAPNALAMHPPTNWTKQPRSSIAPGKAGQPPFYSFARVRAPPSLTV